MQQRAADANSGPQATRKILQRLGFDAAAKQDRPFIAEDFVFKTSDYASARELRNVHEEVVLEETPLALFRQIHLEHTERPSTSLRLRLGLCWNGFPNAMTLLARFPQSFQRAIPPGAIVNAAEQYGTGDFGLAWAWSGEGEPDILAFVTNNVLVTIEGHDARAVVLALARELAEVLGNLRTGPAYAEEPEGLFADVRRRVGEVARLRPGERLDLGVLPEDGSTLFFLTSVGAVNRSPERTDSWYYRAGAERGRQGVILFRVGNGILPVMERFTVEIT